MLDPSKNLEVTVLDALRVREIVLLILSFLLRETHNMYILVDSNYIADDSVNKFWFQIGAIIGLILTGVLADLVLTKKRFVLLFGLNTLFLIWDIYLFHYVRIAIPGQTDIFFSVLLGMFMEGTNLVYLILIPMLIARQMQHNVALVAPNKVCFAGTIVGLVLAMALTGKFLVS